MKKSLLYTCLFGLGALTLASCSDPMEEIESLIYGRVFSPTDLEVKNIKESSATLVWNASAGASKYTVEVYEDDSLSFTGNIVIKGLITGTTDNLAGLTYDTQYSVKVIANDSTDSARDSKASTVYFRTSAQQIFSTPKEVDIADRSVILSWKEGETDVTRIDILDEAGAVVTSHAITDEEKAAFKATVTGLSPETKYTAKLYYVNSNNVQKERGSKTFTTIVDLNGAKVLRPTDDIQEAINNAEDGDVFALYGGTYVVKSSSDDESVTAGSIAVSKNITIKGIFPTNIPTINGRFELNDGATLTINQVNLNGAGTSGDQCFNVKGTSIGGIEINNAEIKNYAKGVHYVNVAAKIPYIKYVNCLIHDITCDGGDMFDCRKGCIDDFTLSKSTIYNSCAARDFIRFDDASASFSGATPVVTVDQCTINAAANTSGKRLLYVRFVGNSIVWTNNLVTNTVAVWSNQSKTAVPSFGNNNVYYGCTKLNVLDGADGGKTNLFIDEQRTEADPQYKNAASGDFTIGNSSVSKLNVGDPRWR